VAKSICHRDAERAVAQAKRMAIAMGIGRGCDHSQGLLQIKLVDLRGSTLS
jgi:hypothetical protein